MLPFQTLIYALSFVASALSLPHDEPLWLNKSALPEDRLQAFLGQLNESQIYAMVQGDTVLDDHGTGINACIGHISGVEALGISSVCMGDGPVGVSNSMNNVTTFPAPIMMSSGWNTTAEYIFGQMLADEQRMKGRNVVLSPTINILRSPLWARAAETLSEDPHLTARLAVAQVKGIQSRHALACPKHFAAYNQDTNRFGVGPEYDAVNAVVDERSMQELYLPAFKATVQEAKAASVMCSYNKFNGQYACENEFLLNKTLKNDWGFTGFVVADWYFAQRSTVASANNGMDISMPGGSLVDSFGFPAYYGGMLKEAVSNGSVEFSRVRDMVERLWRPMFELGAIDHPPEGNATAVARTQEHLDFAQELAEDGMVLLKNEQQLLPLSKHKYKKIAMFGRGATNDTHVTEEHGGFALDSTMLVQAPFSHIKKRGEKEGISVRYAEAHPGTGPYPTVPSSMFRDLKATYWNNTDWSGKSNQTVYPQNITSGMFPKEMFQAWPDVFSSKYEGKFLPKTTGLYYFSLYGQGDAVLFLNGQQVVTMTKQNFGNPVSGVVELKAGKPVDLYLKYSMGFSLSTSNFGVTLGVDVASELREEQALELASWADLSIVVVNDDWTEGADSNIGLQLPSGQDELISKIASASSKTLVVLGTNSAILMPWIEKVEGILEMWYPGQQVGLALERILYGDISPSGKLPLTFPKTLEDAIQITSDLDVHFNEGLNVGYKKFDKYHIQPLFPFGFGLTYSSFSLEHLRLGMSYSGSSIISNATLKNTGSYKAKQVVQLYVSYPKEANEPPKLLKGFQKVELAVGQTWHISIEVKKDDLRIWDEVLDDWRLIKGKYEIMLGFSAHDILEKKHIYL
ncbi:glycoside hydrolase family 3 domain protein [Fusarium beomiforme]|uniref:beta-glucosidase n=1 Tax=Fusarium beomiforme TaxID=44412 RepID=A0A9P5AF44_9HYPO|nr:glycoside hydrolase family 3 domain protein [Fusarium beomiforme]